MDSRFCSGFCELFGKNNVRVLRFVRVRLFGKTSNVKSLQADLSKIDININFFYDSIDFVDKLWENLRESMWGSRWKRWSGFVEKRVLHKIAGKFAHNLGICGKIYKRFTQPNNRGKSGVLHVLHSAYYYNY